MEQRDIGSAGDNTQNNNLTFCQPRAITNTNDDDTDTEEEFEDDSTALMGRNYEGFLKKLQNGVLEAPKLNLQEVPPSIFDYVPSLSVIQINIVLNS